MGWAHRGPCTPWGGKVSLGHSCVSLWTCRLRLLLPPRHHGVTETGTVCGPQSEKGLPSSLYSKSLLPPCLESDGWLILDDGGKGGLSVVSPVQSAA